jgi:hypothetical protein
MTAFSELVDGKRVWVEEVKDCFNSLEDQGTKREIMCEGIKELGCFTETKRDTFKLYYGGKKKYALKVSLLDEIYTITRLPAFTSNVYAYSDGVLLWQVIREEYERLVADFKRDISVEDQ